VNRSSIPVNTAGARISRAFRSLFPIVSLLAFGGLVEAGDESATLHVRVAVPSFARVTSSSLPETIEIQAKDLARGLIEMDVPAHVDVFSNSVNGFMLNVIAQPEVVAHIRLNEASLPRTIDLPAEGGVVTFRNQTSHNRRLNMAFQFSLRPDISPGIYPFPVSIQVEPIRGE